MDTPHQTDQTAGPAHRLTPMNAPNNRQEMKPLPLRVASKQYERLQRARDRTGISIQEHIRRGIDMYLASTEREAIELGLMQTATTPSPTTSPTPKPKPKVAKK
jgi:hypothetical protein